MILLFFRSQKIKGCGKKTGHGVIWVEKRCFRPNPMEKVFLDQKEQ
jgi:hypothetical protein